MLDVLNFIALGLVLGTPLGWLACIRWNEWRFRKRKREQDERERALDQRSIAVSHAEDEVRKAADALRPYSSSNR
jgi:hypothetical protein